MIRLISLTYQLAMLAIIDKQMITIAIATRRPSRVEVLSVATVIRLSLLMISSFALLTASFALTTVCICLRIPTKTSTVLGGSREVQSAGSSSALIPSSRLIPRSIGAFRVA